MRTSIGWGIINLTDKSMIVDEPMFYDCEENELGKFATICIFDRRQDARDWLKANRDDLNVAMPGCKFEVRKIDCAFEI
jgi:hypothetical protein